MNVTSIRYRVLLLLLCLFCLPAFAQNNDDIPLYNHCWDDWSNEALMQKGEYYRNEAFMPDSALVCFTIVVNRYYQGYQTHDDIEHVIEALTHISWLYMRDFYNYAKAVTYNLQAFDLAKKYECYGYMPFILINKASLKELADMFKNTEEYKTEVMNILKQAFAMALEQKQWDAVYHSFIDLAAIASFDDRVDIIMDETDTIRNLHPSDLSTLFKYARCLAEGVIAQYEHQLDSAVACFNRLLDIALEHDNRRQQAFFIIKANDYLSFCYGEMGEYEKALAAFKVNEELANNSNLQLQLLDAYMNLAGYYQFLGDEEMFERYRILYLEKEVDMMTRQGLLSANDTQFLFQLDKKNEKIRRIAQRERMKKRELVGSIAFSITLLVFLALLFINYRKLKEQNRKLYSKSLEMIRADEEKRELIERLQNEINKETKEVVKDETIGETKRRTHTLDEDRMSDLMQRIFIVMETCDEIYSPDFSLPRLSELVGDKRNNVSEAINQRYKTNFNGLLNEYRIKEACRRFNASDQYGNLTIEAIGQSVGFKSRSAFSTVFKQIVGLSPSAYLRQVGENQS